MKKTLNSKLIISLLAGAIFVGGCATTSRDKGYTQEQVYNVPAEKKYNSGLAGCLVNGITLLFHLGL